MDTTVHRSGAHRVGASHFPALLTLCVAVLVAQIDTAVVNLGTHRIGAYFHASVCAQIGLALTGVGMGLATGPLMGEAVGAVPAARSGTASALINVARMVGATVGVAALGAVYAAFRGGPEGLRFAMLIGGLAQLSGASYAWVSTAARSAGRLP